MKKHHPSSNQNTIFLPPLQESHSQQLPSHSHTSQDQKINHLSFFRSRRKKAKKIIKKPQTMMLKLSLESPLSFNHVFNFLNILSINERTLKDPSHEESYFKSIFYIKKVQKVQIRKNAIIIFTKNLQTTLTPVQYLIERFRSYGDNDFYQLANSIELSHRLYQTTNFASDLLKSYDGEPLSRFIEAMQQRIYACKVAPNKIVLSRRLLELLEQDMELYGLKLCKYKTPFRQIISGQSYYRVIKRCIDNIGLISEFLRKRTNFQQLQSKSCLEFNDYLYTQQQKKIYCRMRLHMPTTLINCVEVVEQFSESEDCDRYWKVDGVRRRGMERECSEQRYLQAETLRHLIQISDSLLVKNKKRLAGYCLKQISP